MKKTTAAKVNDMTLTELDNLFGGPWPEPEPLPDDLPPVQALNPDIIPGPLRPWILDIAERMQIKPDFPAAAAVVALASIVGRKLGIKPKRQDDWLVIPNLWGAIVGRPALMKTPAIEEAARPLKRLMVQAQDDYESDLRDYREALEVIEVKRKARRSNMERAAKKGDEALLERLTEERIEPPEEPVLRRFLVQDATVEKLVDLLKQNTNGLLLMRDELIGWLRALDRDGRETDRAFYLEAWNGNGLFTIDRIGRGTTVVNGLCLSVFGTIQPGPLAEYVYQASVNGAGADGLLQRFQVLVWPDMPASWRNVDRWPEGHHRERACHVFDRLNDATPYQLGAQDHEHCPLPVLRFTEAAQAVFNAWWSDLEENKLRGQDNGPAMESHLAKYRSLFPSLALLFHLVDTVSDSAAPGPVSERAAQQAGAWCDYLESHARRLYASVEAPEIDAARALLRKCKAGAIKLEDGGFRERAIYAKGWSRLSTADQVKKAVDLLAQFEWVRIEQLQTGGRPSRFVHVHPLLRPSI